MEHEEEEAAEETWLMRYSETTGISANYSTSSDQASDAAAAAVLNNMTSCSSRHGVMNQAQIRQHEMITTDHQALTSTGTTTTSTDHNNQNKNHSNKNNRQDDDINDDDDDGVHDHINDLAPIEADDEEELLAERNNILIHMQSHIHNNSSTSTTAGVYNVLPNIINCHHQPLLFPDHVDYNQFELENGAQCQDPIDISSGMNEVEVDYNNKNLQQQVNAVTDSHLLGNATKTSTTGSAVVLQQLQMASEQQQQVQQVQQQQGRSPYRTQMQRENHILAERQRREEMNEKFTVLRSLLPKLTKKDKASIVTDTINYIRELEKKVAALEACRNKRKANHTHGHSGPISHKGLDGSISREKANSQTLNLRPQRDHPLISVKQDEQDCNLPLSNLHEDHSRRVKVGQVEIEDLGTNAVIKVLTTRTHGLVLRLHLALEDCKVEVIQSNVTTIGDNMVHFVTVGLNVGTSATLVELATTLQLAITQPMKIMI